MIQYNLPEEKFLWKFFDLYKFISFLKTNEIVFCRLDLFEDFMEGCSEEMAFWLINALRIAELPQSKRNPNLSPEVFEEKSSEFIRRLNTLKECQKFLYASCFYTESEESTAMWKLFTGVQGVAIKFDSVELFKNLREVYNKTLIDKMELGGNKMNYINLFRINPYTDDGKIKILDHAYSPYNKDISYQHENEYRFILINNDPKLVDGEIKTIKIDLDEKYFDFIVSPETENWKKELLNQLIHESGLNKTVIDSNIVAKEVITKHKVKFLDDLLGDYKLPGRTFTRLYT